MGDGELTPAAARRLVALRLGELLAELTGHLALADSSRGAGWEAAREPLAERVRAYDEARDDLAAAEGHAQRERARAISARRRAAG